MDTRLYLSDQYIIFEGKPVAKVWEGACEVTVKKFEYFLQDLEEIMDEQCPSCGE
jgi:hypothetical protein